MVGEAPVQRLAQLTQLPTQLPFRQIGQHLGVALTGDQRFEHRPPGDAHDVGGDRGELDARVLEQLLQPLDLPSPLPGQRGARPGQVAQRPDRRRWHERATDQAVRAELSQPRRIRDVGLAAGHVAGMAGVDEHQLPRAVLEHVVERLPVVAGGLHHHTRDLRSHQVLTPGRHRRPARRPWRPSWRYRARHSAGAPRPSLPLPSTRTAMACVPGRAGRRSKSDARAQGNSPRFPWEPSTVMLTYRLAGTTEVTTSDRDAPPSLRQRQRLPPEPRQEASLPRIFTSPSETPRVSRTLTCSNSSPRTSGRRPTTLTTPSATARGSPSSVSYTHLTLPTNREV